MSTDYTSVPLTQSFDSRSFQATIRQAMQETLFLNSRGINPRQLRDVIQECSTCFQQFLADSDNTGVEGYGQKLASIGIGYQAILALVQAVNQWCGTSESPQLRQVGSSSSFSTPLLLGYMQAREQRLLYEQEQTRMALDRARENS